MPRTTDELSIGEARRIALSAQGLRGRSAGGGVPAMVRRLGAVQLDTISVLARSHELVAYARHGAVGRAAVERAYWGRGSATFEYWSHAACVIPLEDWPLYEFKRRARRAKGKRWHDLADRERSCAEVVGRLRADGPLTANELGGAKKSGVWWDWSETKIAAEWLLDIGELVCRERRGFQRVYDLTERAIPAHAPPRPSSPTRSAPCGWWPRPAAPSASARWATWPSTTACPSAWFARCSPKRDWSRSGCRAGSPWPMPIRPPSPRWVARAKGRSLLLSPFDSLCWYRDRLERLFGVRHRLEAYTPRHQRTYGYFAMPVLGDTEIVGLVDPGRRDGALVAKQVTLFRAEGVGHVAAALGAAARWVGCDRVIVERVAPATARRGLESLVAEAASDFD